jgi:YggT family protein
MLIIGTIIGWVLWIFLLVLFARMILSWIPVLVRDWQPRGPMLVVAEVIYSVTDPPLRALRKVLKPVRIGNMMLDLAFIGLAIGVSILMQLNRAVFFRAIALRSSAALRSPFRGYRSSLLGRALDRSFVVVRRTERRVLPTPPHSRSRGHALRTATCPSSRCSHHVRRQGCSLG